METFISKSKYLLFILGAMALVTACGGGGGDGTPTISQGKFIDAAVEGITYTSGSTTGETDASGTFSYESGSSVTFSVGGITIGTVSGAAIITPVQLVSGATSETDPTVTNIVQFLLTIDDDDDASNGIQITPAIRAAAVGLSVDFASATFDSDVIAAVATLTFEGSAGLRTLVSASFAAGHLSDSLFSLLAGDYSGTYGGTSSGSWTLTVATDGSITGTATEAGISGTIIVAGSITSSGSTSATGSGTADGSIWTGTINISTGAFTGSWSGPAAGEGGSATGSKI